MKIKYLEIVRGVKYPKQHLLIVEKKEDTDVFKCRHCKKVLDLGSDCYFCNGTRTFNCVDCDLKEGTCWYQSARKISEHEHSYVILENDDSMKSYQPIQSGEEDET